MIHRPDKRILLSYPHMSGDELRLVKDAFESNWIAPLGPMSMPLKKRQPRTPE